MIFFRFFVPDVRLLQHLFFFEHVAGSVLSVCGMGGKGVMLLDRLCLLNTREAAHD